jgi:hypothetical protein
MLLWCATARLTAGTLSGNFASIEAGTNVDLTLNGKLDWVHWGLYTDSSVDRKAGVVPMIGDYHLIANTNSLYVTAYQFADNANGYTWYDGSPRQNVTNTTTGLWCYGYPISLESGFEFSVPADTNQRTLKVFVGAFNGKGQFTASLSDGSAPDFTNGINSTVNNLGNGPSGVFTINYSANSPGKMLTVRWTLQLARGANANVTLQAASLTAPGADSPPYVVMLEPINNSALVEPANITIHANAQDTDGTVTNVEFYSGATKLGETNIPPYIFNWAGVARGDYSLRAAATDNKGSTSFSQPVEVFVFGSGGTQSAVVANSPASVNLTVEGTTDWTHWGLVTNTSFNHKTVQRQISNFLLLGTNAVKNYGDNQTAFSWSDGEPTSEVIGTTTGVFVTGLGDGFQLTAPADTNARTLRVFVGGYGVLGEFKAYLSDLSAQPYADTTVSNVFDNSYATYTVNYSAASADQQLIVRYRATDSFDATYGNVTLQAATLQGGPVVPARVRIIEPRIDSGQFLFSFLTQSNLNYVIQSVDALAATNWTEQAVVPGTGSMVTVTNTIGSTFQQFYRVQTQ